MLPAYLSVSGAQFGRKAPVGFRANSRPGYSAVLFRDLNLHNDRTKTVDLKSRGRALEKEPPQNRPHNPQVRMESRGFEHRAELIKTSKRERMDGLKLDGSIILGSVRRHGGC